MFKMPASDNERIRQQFSGHNIETQIKAQILFKLYTLGILLLCILTITYITVSPDRLILVLKEVSPAMFVLILSIFPLFFGHYHTSIIITLLLGLLSNATRNFFPDFLNLLALPLIDNTARLMLLLLFIVLFSKNHRVIFSAFASTCFLLLCYSKMQYQTYWNTELKTCLVLICGSFLIGFLTRMTHSITIKKLDESQDALKQSEGKFRNLVESSSDWVWEVNADAKYTYSSPVVQDVLGYRPEEILGKTLFNFISPDQATEIAAILNDKLAHKLPIKNLEYIGLHKDGGKVVIETSGVPVFDSTGQFIGCRGVNRDITERKNVQKELETAKTKAEASLRAKSDFLSNMSHEIRTPMNAVLGFINLVLQDKKLSDSHHNYLTTAKNAAGNLLDLLNKIIDVSKLESGMLTFECSPFSLSRLISEIRFTLDATVREKNLNISYEIHPSLSDAFNGDQLRIRQLLVALIDNAIKFTKKGSISIKIMPAEKENQIHFSVTDTGIGIPDNQLNKIFEPFTQLDSSMTRKFGGIGMGLAAAKNIAEMMRGRIWVQSRKDQGSTFHFIIELPQTDQHPENATFHYSMAKTDFPTHRKCFRILMAEDNKMNAALSEIRLKEQGHSIKIVQNGQDAVNAVLNETFDVILMDIHMPKTDGIKATRQIRELEINTGKHLPIIAVTADQASKTNKKYLENGIDAVVSKPVNFDTLFDIMEHLVQDRTGQIPQKNKIKPCGETTVDKDATGLEILFIEMLQAFSQFNPYILKPHIDELRQYVSQNQLDPLTDHLKRFDFKQAEKETIKLMKKLKINHGG